MNIHVYIVSWEVLQGENQITKQIDKVFMNEQDAIKYVKKAKKKFSNLHWMIERHKVKKA